MILKVENITKFFGTVKAVDGLSFSADKGDIIGLLGPNGAGKTTTIRMISSYYFPTSGKIFVNNVDTQKNTVKTQNKIGYLPENNPLYMDMLVIDYLSITYDLVDHKHTKKYKQDKIIEIAKKINIENKLGTTINELSKGYKQRVGIAAALLHDPDLLILDEHNEGLDPAERIRMRELIKDLATDKAIIISTHVMEEVKTTCNKVIIINEGKIILEGKPDEVGGIKTLHIKLKGANKSEVETKINKILEENESVEVKSGEKDDSKDDVLEVYIKSNRELQPKISELVLSNKWVIFEMDYKDSLEQVFRDIKK